MSATWSYVTASPSHHDKAIVSFAFMHVGHPYIPLFKTPRIFDLLVYITTPLTSVHTMPCIIDDLVHVTRWFQKQLHVYICVVVR